MKIEVTQCSMCTHYNTEQYCEVWEQYITNDAFYCACGAKADRKTEPTISKMEQVETMSCAECKHRPIGAEICEEPCHYEPQTDWHYDEQDATWYPYKHEDEPQQKSCATCKHALGNWDGESNNCGRCCGADRRFYEPIEDEQTEREGE